MWCMYLLSVDLIQGTFACNYPKNLKKRFSSFLVQRILCLNDLVIAYLKSPVPATAPLSARGERKWNFSLSPLQARLCSSLTRPTLAFFTTFLLQISVQTVLCHTAPPSGHCYGHRVSSVPSWWHVPVSSPLDGLLLTPDSRHCVSVRCSRRARRPLPGQAGPALVIGSWARACTEPCMHNCVTLVTRPVCLLPVTSMPAQRNC